MTIEKVIVFDISGEYGHFRKFNTTSSPLTYSLPSRPTIAGFIGAIMGVEREIAINVFRKGVVPVNELFSLQKSAIAIEVIAPIKKTQMAFNLLDTSKQGSSFFNIKNRTQIEFEFLKDPCFRIYFAHEDESIMQKLEERVKNRSHHFTPYLGLAQLTANVDFRGVHTCEKKENKTGFIKINSAVNLSDLNTDTPIDFRLGSYTVDTHPLQMNTNRVVEKYAEILIERTGKTGEYLQVNTPFYYQINQEKNILFL